MDVDQDRADVPGVIIFIITGCVASLIIALIASIIMIAYSISYQPHAGWVIPAASLLETTGAVVVAAPGFSLA
jgi:hypothetical protein